MGPLQFSFAAISKIAPRAALGFGLLGAMLTFAPTPAAAQDITDLRFFSIDSAVEELTDTVLTLLPFASAFDTNTSAYDVENMPETEALIIYATTDDMSDYVIKSNRLVEGSITIMSGDAMPAPELPAGATLPGSNTLVHVYRITDADVVGELNDLDRITIEKADGTGRSYVVTFVDTPTAVPTGASNRWINSFTLYDQTSSTADGVIGTAVSEFTFDASELQQSVRVPNTVTAVALQVRPNDGGEDVVINGRTFGIGTQGNVQPLRSGALTPNQPLEVGKRTQFTIRRAIPPPATDTTEPPNCLLQPLPDGCVGVTPPNTDPDAHVFTLMQGDAAAPADPAIYILTVTRQPVGDAPTDLLATLSATSATPVINLVWEPPADVTRYEVRWKESSTTSYAEADEMTVTNLNRRSVSISRHQGVQSAPANLRQGASYDLEVAAVATDGTPKWSGITTIIAHARPSAPRNFVGVGGNAVIELAWDEPSNTSLVDYHLSTKLSSSGTWSDSIFIGNTKTTISLACLQAGDRLTSAAALTCANGGSYDFRVRAANAAGTSGWSGTVRATPTAEPPIPVDLFLYTSDTVDDFGELTFDFSTEVVEAVDGVSPRVPGRESAGLVFNSAISSYDLIVAGKNATVAVAVELATGQTATINGTTRTSLALEEVEVAEAETKTIPVVVTSGGATRTYNIRVTRGAQRPEPPTNVIVDVRATPLALTVTWDPVTLGRDLNGGRFLGYNVRWRDTDADGVDNIAGNADDPQWQDDNPDTDPFFPGDTLGTPSSTESRADDSCTDDDQVIFTGTCGALTAGLGTSYVIPAAYLDATATYEVQVSARTSDEEFPGIFFFKGGQFSASETGSPMPAIMGAGTDSALSGLTSNAVSTAADGTVTAGNALTLEPATFDPMVRNYTAEVDFSDDEISVTAVFAAVGYVSVNRREVTTATASRPVSLEVGNNSIDVLVHAENVVNTTRYTIRVTRAAPDFDITLTGGAFATGKFDPKETTQEITVARDATQLSVAGGFVSGATATVGPLEIDRDKFESLPEPATFPGEGAPQSVTLKADTQAIEIVYAEGGAEQAYVLNITRPSAVTPTEQAQAVARAVVSSVVLSGVLDAVSQNAFDATGSFTPFFGTGSASNRASGARQQAFVPVAPVLLSEQRPRRDADWRDLLGASAFRLGLNHGGAEDGEHSGEWSVWGTGDVRGFNSGGINGGDGDMETKGMGYAGYLGTDYRSGNWLAGFAAGYSTSTTTITMEEAEDETSEFWLAGLYPYVRYTWNNQIESWLLAGAGGGQLSLKEADASAYVISHLYALGFKAELVRFGDFSIAAKLDGSASFALSIETDDLEDFDTMQERLRVGFDMAYDYAADVHKLRPHLEVGARVDFGEVGEDIVPGAEVAGGLRYEYAPARFSVDLRGRALVYDSIGILREWGAGATLRMTPSASGEGVAISLTPGWGLPQSRADEMWEDNLTLGEARTISNAATLRAEMSYSFRHKDTLITPLTSYNITASNHVLGLGTRIKFAPLSLEVVGERVDIPFATDEYRLRLTSSLRF